MAPISIGTIRGGDWHSTVPHEAVMEGRFGVFPRESLEDARRTLTAALDEAAAADPWLREHPPELTWFEGQFESGETPIDSPLVRALGASHHAVTGELPGLEGVPYGSDMRFFTNQHDIRNSRRIAGVMVRGRWLSRTDLDRVLDEIRSPRP